MKQIKLAIERAERQENERLIEQSFLRDLETSHIKITSGGRFPLTFSPSETKQIESLLREIFTARNVVRVKAIERLNLINELYTGDK